nr:hypothetical protein BaRGS_006796 [Batillaria attramentaria]
METIRNLRKEGKRAYYKAGRLHTEDNRDDGDNDHDYRRHNYTDDASSRSDDKYNHRGFDDHNYTGDDDYDSDTRGYDYNYRGYDYNHRGHDDYNYRGHDDYNYRGHDDYNYKGHDDYNYRGHDDYNYKGHDDYNYRGHDDYDHRRRDRHDYGDSRRGRVGSARARGNNISTLRSGRVAVSQGDAKDNHTTDSNNRGGDARDVSSPGSSRTIVILDPSPASVPPPTPVKICPDVEECHPCLCADN